MFLTKTNKLHQLILSIRCICIVHRGTAVPKTPFWTEECFPRQTNKGFGDIKYTSASEKIIINISRLSLPTAVSCMIIIYFIT